MSHSRNSRFHSNFPSESSNLHSIQLARRICGRLCFQKSRRMLSMFSEQVPQFSVPESLQLSCVALGQEIDTHREVIWPARIEHRRGVPDEKVELHKRC